MTIVTGLTGVLASSARHKAQTAVIQDQLTVLATSYDQHVALLSRRGPGPHCGHASEPPYIVISGAEARAWCAGCVQDVLPERELPCGECPGQTEVYMFPYGEIVVVANICQDCGGNPRLS